MKGWKKIVLVLLFPIAFISFLVRYEAKEEPVRTFTITNNVTLEIYLEDVSYLPVLNEKKFFFNQKTSFSPLYKNHTGVYLDYTIFTIGGFDYILGVVQNGEVAKVHVNTSSVQVEHRVEEELFILAIPDDGEPGIAHPTVELQQGAIVEYPFTLLRTK